MGMKYAGARVERREDEALLRGEGWFTDDIRAKGALVATFVRSQVAHAKISVNLEAARAVPGVGGAWAAADLPEPLRGKELPIWVPTAAMSQVRGFPPLAIDEVTYVGEPIAVILADSRHVAEDAADLAVVSYDPLPVVASCEAAIAEGGPVTHDAAKDNIAARFTVEYGDVQKAFSESAVTVKGRFRIHRGVCHAMECRAVLADFDPRAGKLTLWSATQAPHLVKSMLVEVLNLDDDHVRVIAPDVGGGFGPKGIVYQEEAVLPALSRLLGRPVRWTEDRREHFVATTQERDQIWEMEAAAKADGRLLAVRGSMLHDNGAYVPHGVVNPLISSTTLPGPYLLPNYRLEVASVYTNKPAVTPLRGAGRPQAVFVMERLMDRLARATGLDSADIRRRNLIQPEQMPYKVGLRFRDGSPVTYDSGDYPRCQSAALKKIDHAGFRARQEAARREGRYIGLGIANYVEGTGLGPYETSSARVLPDGGIAIASGASPQGQGHKTMLAQIAADALGVSIEDIEVTVGDTDAIRYGMNTFASRTTVNAGSSMLNAATRLRRNILALAAHVLEEQIEALTIESRFVTTVRPSNKRILLSSLRRMAAGMPGITVPASFEPGLFVQETFKPPQAAYANGCHAVEVEVDPATGKVDILRYCVAHDCGTIVNPLIVDGQIQGGVAHGIGNALLELMRYDKEGQPVTTTLTDYLLPTAPDVPDVEIVHIESPCPHNPLGAKGAGEGGTIPAAAAIISAIESALAPFGVEISESPILPDRLCELIEVAGAAQKSDACSLVSAPLCARFACARPLAERDQHASG
jgi:carbon-monoxide dehydrogenase large subunit